MKLMWSDSWGKKKMNRILMEIAGPAISLPMMLVILILHSQHCGGIGL